MMHTPGPWQLSDNGLGVFGPGKDPWGIAWLSRYEKRAIAQGQGIADEEQRANARLIAAAPGLLGRLEQCLHTLEKWHEIAKHEQLLIGLVKKTIAQAMEPNGGE